MLLPLRADLADVVASRHHDVDLPGPGEGSTARRACSAVAPANSSWEISTVAVPERLGDQPVPHARGRARDGGRARPGPARPGWPGSGRGSAPPAAAGPASGRAPAATRGRPGGTWCRSSGCRRGGTPGAAARGIGTPAHPNGGRRPRTSGRVAGARRTRPRRERPRSARPGCGRRPRPALGGRRLPAPPGPARPPLGSPRPLAGAVARLSRPAAPRSQRPRPSSSSAVTASGSLRRPGRRHQLSRSPWTR